MHDFLNDFLINALFFFGFPASTFETTDPVAVLVLFIFSTHILALILAFLIWMFVYSKHHHYKSGSDFGGLMRSTSEIKKHSYGCNDIFKSGQKGQGKSSGSSFFMGFLIPVAVLFGVIYAVIWIIRDTMHI